MGAFFVSADSTRVIAVAGGLMRTVGSGLFEVTRRRVTRNVYYVKVNFQIDAETRFQPLAEKIDNYKLDFVCYTKEA
jgi:hypothetical protein